MGACPVLSAAEAQLVKTIVPSIAQEAKEGLNLAEIKRFTITPTIFNIYSYRQYDLTANLLYVMLQFTQQR
ncbi:hypothetical protein [Crinalium epipsammum]|uniref:hypothetical protein n=1 Tax=Crinalium epipsammum TaxID=241425 RepID=UPI0002F7B75A|nr:hypothetical protein [Crinalium epipsammum]